MAEHESQEPPTVFALPSATVSSLLMLSIRSQRDAMTRSAQLTRHGYLGCLPFAHIERDEIVLRAQPAAPVAEWPVGYVTWELSGVDGQTIAPRMKEFVAGRLVHIDCARATFRLTQRGESDLLAYADSLGGIESVRAVLKARSRAAKEGNPALRRAVLYEAIAPSDSLFAALAVAWRYERDELAKWLAEHPASDSEGALLSRLRVAQAPGSEAEAAVRESAWKIVEGDVVFDSTFVGVVRGAVRGSRSVSTLGYAVRYLRAHLNEDVRYETRLWQAAQAAVDDSEYAGRLHLAAADDYISVDPRTAYSCFANAIAYSIRATPVSANRSTVAVAVHRARELAVANGWTSMSTLFEAVWPTARST